MVRRERNKRHITFIPECVCNKKVVRIKYQDRVKPEEREIHSHPEAQSKAEDHEELHMLSKTIVNFIADTGKMQKEDIIEAFPDYNEGQLSMAANMSMYPIVFPKKRRGTWQQIEQIKEHAYRITDEYRKAKYATDNVDVESTEDNGE